MNIRTLLLHGVSATVGVVCALTLLPWQRSAAPEGFVENRAFRTTVYAPSAAAARVGQQEVQYARQRFQHLFGRAQTEVTVILVDQPEHFRHISTIGIARRGTRILPFVTQTHRQLNRGSNSGTPLDMKPLAHEACHIYISALTDKVAKAPAVPDRAYGHHALPDWFDEAAATLCESKEGRAKRRQQFRAGVERRIPLREFERMRHPLSQLTAIGRLSADAGAAGMGIRYIPAAEAKKQLPVDDAQAFYAQALSLSEFIAYRGGPHVLQQLIEPLANGRTLDQALRQVHHTAPNLPATIDELEREWLHWVLNQTLQ